jgi:hypothetical protein
LPDDYLAWLSTIELRGWLHDAVHREYDRRTDEYDRRQKDRTPPPPPPAEPGLRIRPDEVSLARCLVDIGYRGLARLLHPDAGGDTEEMRRLNALTKSLRMQLTGLEKVAR